MSRTDRGAPAWRRAATTVINRLSRPAGIAPVDAAPAVVAFLVDTLIWDSHSRLRTWTGGDSLDSWVVPVAGAFVCAALLLRHGHPMGVFYLQLGYVFAAVLVFSQFAPMAALVVGLYTVASCRPAQLSRWALAACVPVVLAQRVWRPDGEGFEGLWTEVTVGVLVGLVLTSAWGMGHLTRTRVAAARNAANEEALRTERLAIAREIHDILAHTISVMALQAAGARAVMASDPARADAALLVVEDTGQRSIEELRRLLMLLRSSGGKAASDAPTTALAGLRDLEELLSTFRATGLSVDLDISGSPGRLGPGADLTAYRVVQEALTNALRHAGPTAHGQVRLRWQPDVLHVTVENQRPARPARPSRSRRQGTGHGLLGLRERVTGLGGTFHARPTTEGFLVDAQIPVLPSERPAPRPTAASAS